MMNETKKKTAMKMFVFEDVLVDYTAGIAMIVAEDLAAAQTFAYEEFGDFERHRGIDLAGFLERQEGFAAPAGKYDVVGVEPGIKHYVYGGS
jgi:hypothetical protein